MNAESRDRMRVTVARSFDHVVMAMTLRGVTYLGEQRAPYNEEYDGNDLVAASHLIAWRGSAWSRPAQPGRLLAVSRFPGPLRAGKLHVLRL